MSLMVIEGLDGSGKSTQIQNIKDYFTEMGIPFRFLHFPRLNESLYGELIARFLRGELGGIDQVNPYLVATLYAADRADFKPTLAEWLKGPDIVFLDRYVYSNIAYQCAKTKNRKESDELREWILNLEYSYYGLPKPDISIFLDVPFEFTCKNLTSVRSGKDREYLGNNRDIHEDDLDFQEKVRMTYLLQEGEPGFVKLSCATDDGTDILSPDIIFNRITEILKTNHLIP